MLKKLYVTFIILITKILTLSIIIIIYVKKKKNVFRLNKYNSEFGKKHPYNIALNLCNIGTEYKSK